MRSSDKIRLCLCCNEKPARRLYKRHSFFCSRKCLEDYRRKEYRDWKKTCTKCSQKKSLDDFARNKNKPDGRQSSCRQCSSDIHQLPRNKDKTRRAQLMLRYGMTLEDYDRLIKRQGNRCAICRILPKGKRLAIDHIHETKIVRGILCGRCNRFVGYFDKTPYRTIKRVIAYVEKWK